MVEDPKGQGESSSDTDETHNLADVIADNQTIYEMLIAAVSQKVIQLLEQQQAQRRMAFIATLSVIAAATVAIGGFLVNELLSVRVKSAVDIAIGKSLSDARYLSEVAALNFRTLSLQQATGYTDDEAEEFINKISALHRVYVESSDLTPASQQDNREELRFSVETLAELFAGADRLDLATRLERVAPEIAASSDTFTQTMVQALGWQLIGEAGGAQAWRNADGGYSDKYKRYKNYAQRALETGYPELFLTFELITQHMEGRPEEEIRQLAADIGSLNAADKTQFVKIFGAGVAQEYTNIRNAASERVAEVFRGFLAKFSNAETVLDALRMQFGIEIAQDEEQTVAKP